MLSKNFKRIAVVSALLIACVVIPPASAVAGDCKGVRFQITNRLVADGGTPQIVRLKRFVIQSGQTVWSENIRNATVAPNTSFVSDRRRLNRLDSGEVGDFTLYYRHRSPGMAGASAWRDGSFRFSELCTDDKRFFIEIE